MKVSGFRFQGSGFLGLILAWSAMAEDMKFPKNKWFNGLKGYNEALEIQKQTGADLFVYFARYYPSSEEGLCKWWEKRGLRAPEVDKYLDDYIKVKFQYPLNKKEEEATADFKVRKCPAVFIVHTNGFKSYCKVFEWTNKEPELRKPEELIEIFRARSGLKYAETEAEPE